ncbi:MAG: hypothetical protein Q3971_06835, partial [Moraxella sp.]|nr:hypothetical protein [Moraxella sp.]
LNPIILLLPCSFVIIAQTPPLGNTMHYLLTDQAPATISKVADTATKKRTFTGIANSGKPFVYHGVRAIADLSNIAFADKVPVLLLHDRDKRVGVGTLAVRDNTLTITGELLDNEHGQALAKEADAGFPFQMSAHIIADYEEKLSHGQSAVVNGQTITGEMTILRNCRVSEVSFTPTGVDNQTMAMILSEQFTNPNPPSQENTMNVEQLTAQIAELTKKQAEQEKTINELKEQNQKLTDENTALKEQKTKADEEAKNANIEAQLSAKGFTKDDKGNWQGIESSAVEVLLSLDADKAKTMIGSLPAPKKGLPEFLLGETYGTGASGANTPPINPLVANAKARK